MADDKELVVNEGDDGTAVIDVPVEENNDIAVVEEGSEPKPEAKAEAEAKAEDDDNDETDADREAIREERRKERALKKELAKQRTASDKHRINTLSRQNEELARRLAMLENTATSFQMTQLDKALEDEATRVEFAKVKMLEAARAQDAEAQVEHLEQFTEAKKRLEQLQHARAVQLDQAKRPKQNVPTPVSVEVQRNATKWLKANPWYDPAARDTDSRIAKVIDSEMANDGWDPSEPDYWEELDNRLRERLPHRYVRPGDVRRAAPPPGPTAGTRTQPAAPKGNTITLSRERVQAIKDAGAWDDPAKRQRMIKAYMAYDKQNRT